MNLPPRQAVALNSGLLYYAIFFFLRQVGAVHTTRPLAASGLLWYNQPGLQAKIARFRTVRAVPEWPTGPRAGRRERRNQQIRR